MIYTVMYTTYCSGMSALMACVINFADRVKSVKIMLCSNVLYGMHGKTELHPIE